MTIIPRRFTLKNSSQALIREAQTADAAALLAYLHAMAADNEHLLITSRDVAAWQMTAEKEQQWLIDHKKPGNIAICGFVDDELAGLIDVTNGPFIRNRHVGSVHIGIKRRFRNIGLGKALMGTMLQWARGDSLLEILQLEVFANNTPAVALYRKMGFVHEGTKRRHIKTEQGQYIDNVLMAKPLSDKD